MIFFVRTISIAPGKNADAMAFAHKVTQYVKDKFKRDTHISMPIGGNPNRIAFAARYKDLAEYEAVSVKSLADKNYMELVSAGADLWIAGSLRDEIWRTA